MGALSDLELLLVAADLADRESMRTWRSDDLAVETKPDGSPVSATDALIERRLRELLAEHRPRDRVVGEEEGGDLADVDGRRWVIDPIDGTSNYVDGRRAWATLLALEVDGRPVAGVVSMPAVGRRWWGASDDGAYRVELADGAVTPLRVRPAPTADGPLRWTSGPVPEQLDDAERALLDDLQGTFVPQREWTTYPALMVAGGELDVAVQFGHHWDHAAHSAVVLAAGGTITVADPPTPGTRFAVRSTAH